VRRRRIALLGVLAALAPAAAADRAAAQLPFTGYVTVKNVGAGSGTARLWEGGYEWWKGGWCHLGPDQSCTTRFFALFATSVDVEVMADWVPPSEVAGWSLTGCPATAERAWTDETCGPVILDPTKAGGLSRTVQVEFAKRRHELRVSRLGAGRGEVTSEPRGISCGGGSEDCSERVEHDRSMTLRATPAGDGSSFGGWTGGGCSGRATCSVRVGGATSIQAHFLPPAPSIGPVRPRAQLLVSKVGTGAGLIRSFPSGINCGADCSAVVARGAVLTLRALPAPGSRIAGWSGASCGPLETSCQVTMDGHRTVRPRFTLRRHELRVRVVGGGGVRSTPAGVDCAPAGGAGCSRSFDHGAIVELHPVETERHRFAGWDGSCANQLRCRVTMDRLRDVTARFVEVHPLTLARAGDGAGTVTVTPPGTPCIAACVRGVVADTRVTITAEPAAGSTFAGFEGGGCTASPCELLVDGDHTLTARFTAVAERRPLTAAVIAGRGRLLSTPPGIDCGQDCTETFPAGSDVRLRAVPEPGWRIAELGGDCVRSGDECVARLDGPRHVFAAFAREGPPGDGLSDQPLMRPPPIGLDRLDTAVRARVAGVAVRRRRGARTVRVTIRADEAVTAGFRVVRGGRTVARRRPSRLAAGRRTLTLRLPRRTRSGRGQVRVTLSDGAGNVVGFARRVRLPRP
jgi:hypothetical protein